MCHGKCCHLAMNGIVFCTSEFGPHLFVKYFILMFTKCTFHRCFSTQSAALSGILTSRKVVISRTVFPYRNFSNSKRLSINTTTMSSPLVLRLVAAAVSAANRAGNIIRDIMKKGELGIVEKGINDLQTEADRSAQECIILSLSKLFPGVKIIGEEEPRDASNVKEDWIVNHLDEEVLNAVCPPYLANVQDNSVVVWVDPLDGTAEYTQGLLDHVTVLIGIAVDGKAVAGVIHQPYYNYKNVAAGSPLGRTMWGIVGLGAFGFQHVLPPKDKRIITTTRSHGNALVQSALDAMQPDDILRVGGAGHKVLLLVEGIAHAYVFASKGCKKWDTCAPEAILHAVGGKLTDVHGNDLKYHAGVQQMNSGGVLATYEASVHDWYKSRMTDGIRQVLPEVDGS